MVSLLKKRSVLITIYILCDPQVVIDLFQYTLKKYGLEISGEDKMKKTTFIFVIIVIVLFFDLQADVSILVEENAGIARTSEPVTLGVPFAKGVLSISSPVRIVNSSGSTMDSQFKRMALWGDGSIRWLKCDFRWMSLPTVRPLIR